MVGGRLFVIRDPVGPGALWSRWFTGFLLIYTALKKWVFDSFGLLNEFVRQLVTSRRDAGLRCWANWLREDVGSRPHAWLRPDFVTPSLPLKTRKPRHLTSWLIPASLMLSSVRLGCLVYCRSGHLVVTVHQFSTTTTTTTTATTTTGRLSQACHCFLCHLL